MFSSDSSLLTTLDTDSFEKILRIRSKYPNQLLSSIESEIPNQNDIYVSTIQKIKIARDEELPSSASNLVRKFGDIIDFDFYNSNICKLCLKLNANEEKYHENNLDVYEKIQFIMEEPYKDCSFLNFVCRECHKEIDKFYFFKKQCEKNICLLKEIHLKIESTRIVSDAEEKFQDLDTVRDNYEELKISTPNAEEKSERRVTKGTVCEICGKVVKGIQMHMLIHFNVKKFKCNIGDCKKSFTQSGQLRRHINSHLNIRNYACPHPDCDRKFVDPSSVTKHLVIHNKEDRKFVCSICAARFNRLGALRYHEKTHRQERNHKCSVCEKSFLAKYDLKKHFRIHTGEKPYSCPYCSKKFTISKNAKVHLRVHTKHKPYTCTLCDLSFSYRSSLKQHLLKIHQASDKSPTRAVQEEYTIDVNLI